MASNRYHRVSTIERRLSHNGPDGREATTTMLADPMDAAVHRIMIVPNRSLGVTGLWFFYAGSVGLTLALAAWFAFNGFWPVLAYAIVELLLLGACLLASWRQGFYGELITVQEDCVWVEKGYAGHLERNVFNRYWAQVVVRVPHARLHPKRMYLRSHGRECEIGRCLTEAQRKSLEKRLAELIGPLGEAGSGHSRHGSSSFKQEIPTHG
ncbi:MAG: DUF2244 domain-containing protein [Gammaproteobacteria bacterium]|nr:DUF2244 domain-containing protein [Gammaproteobacteria bacterium]MDE2345426.1 DUF2244 domain-containing protein [Gammaproteobacteria bacterium]